MKERIYLLFVIDWVSSMLGQITRFAHAISVVLTFKERKTLDKARK